VNVSPTTVILHQQQRTCTHDLRFSFE